MTRTADAYDELAALFLTAPEMGPRRGNGTLMPPAPRLEIVLAGHLPVRGALWLGPYADARACAAGPTALVRLDADGPSVELFRSPRPGGRDGSAASLRDAVETMRGTISTWIVRPAHEATDGAAIASALGEAPGAALTILTGADEAAIVAAYQAIKDVATAARQQSAAQPRIALALLGCDEARAAQVVQRIDQTTSSFLDVELALAACVPSIGAGLRATGYQRFAGDPSPPLGTVLGWISGEAAGPPKLALAAPFAEAAPPPRRRPTAVPTVTIETATRIKTVEVPAIAPAIAPVPAAPTIKLRPKPAASLEPESPPTPPAVEERSWVESSGEPSLATHVEGLRALPARCPNHEGIEIAADLAGTLHVLAWEKDLRALRGVEAWAAAHVPLLAMACPQLGIDTGAKVMSHLFTQTPASLADLHGCGLRLHVLAPVRVGDQKAWYAAPLNSPPT